MFSENVFSKRNMVCPYHKLRWWNEFHEIQRVGYLKSQKPGFLTIIHGVFSTLVSLS